MSLKKFIAKAWSDGEDELRDVEELKRVLDQLRQHENEIYIISVKSNQ